MVDEANETNVASADAATVDGSAQNLDSLLSEFDSEANASTTDANAPNTETDENYGKKAYEMMQAEQSRRASEQYRLDMDKSVSTMREIVGEGTDNAVLEAYLEGEAKRDSRIATAFQARYDNPAGWENVVKAVGKKLADGLNKQPDSGLQDSLDAVRANTNVKSNNGPDDDQYSMSKLNQMTDWELNKAIKEYASNMK